MAVQLNHTIVHATSKEVSADFLASLLGLEVRPQYGPFLPVVTANEVALDFADADGRPITPQHYAFIVSEEEFDAIFDRVRGAGITYYADPFHERPGEINHNDGGRGVYWADPDGHSMEIITRPYGSGG
ncbi:MAG: VOC family protein [Streptomyces sp.]|uniref:VOC family protein n=1 Tax=Streptomyces sp. TaxID=1931 RepID=UPI003D6A52A7